MILTVTLNAAIDKRYVVSGFQEGEVNRVLECEYTPGGKGLNVSKPASIAGAKVIATGFVGGFAGQYIESALVPFGVKSKFYKLHDESRSCINIWDIEKKKQTEFLEPGFTVSKEDFDGFMKHYSRLVERVDVVAMSGSVPKGLSSDTYQYLIAEAKKQGKKVILDSSGELLMNGITSQPTLVKPNIDEIRMLTGKSCDTRSELLQAAQDIHDKGVGIVAISLGAEGALMVCTEGTYQAKVPKIDAVNTVGCGDSMIAGFAIGLERGYPVDEMLRQASAISTAAALREETGFFSLKDRDRILSQIEIVKL